VEDTRPAGHKPFYACIVVMVATLALNLLSGYIRHTEAGLDCGDWPACYGQVGQLMQPENTAEVADMALTPAATAKRLHRSIATVLVILVFLVVYQARQKIGEAHSGVIRFIPYLMVFVILLLSVIGPASYLKTMPAIATVNLVGGVALLALAWWLWLGIDGHGTVAVPASARRLATLALGVLVVQIVLGAWVSANFAGVACPELFSCGGSGAADAGGVLESFWYFRELTLSEDRIVIERSAEFIHIAHRAGAVVAAVVLATTGVRSLGVSSLQAWSAWLLGLLTLQLALGAFSVLSGLSLGVVLAHNLTATALLLVTIRVVLLTRASNSLYTEHK